MWSIRYRGFRNDMGIWGLRFLSSALVPQQQNGHSKPSVFDVLLSCKLHECRSGDYEGNSELHTSILSMLSPIVG